MKARFEHSMVSYNYRGEEIIAIQILAFKVSYTDMVIPKSYSKYPNTTLLFLVLM